jgi:hypothetical protein
MPQTISSAKSPLLLAAIVGLDWRATLTAR